MSVAPTDPISSYQRDDMSLRSRKQRSRRTKRPAPARKPDPLGPTAERLARSDAPLKNGGVYRAPPTIERMRDREQLAPGDPHLNEMLFQAAMKLEGYAAGAGLNGGVRAQDLTRVQGSAGDHAGDHAAHCLKEFRTALTLMGWFVAYPYRGAGRLTAAVVCEGMGVKEAAALYRPGGSNAAQLGAGMDALREGLFAVAVHWRLIRS